MKLAALVLVSVTAASLAGAALASRSADMCGVVPAGGKKWNILVDGRLTCAKAKAILPKLAPKAKGGPGDVTVNLGKVGGLDCKYIVLSGNYGIYCQGKGGDFMKAAWFH